MPLGFVLERKAEVNQSTSSNKKVNQADLIEGIWKEGKLDGYAKFTFHNGCVLPVKFEQGKLVSDDSDFHYTYFDPHS